MSKQPARLRRASAAWALLAAVLLAACGGAVTQTPEAATTPEISQPDPGAVLALEDIPVEGVDFCAEYPDPEPQPYEAPADSLLAVQSYDHVRGPDEPRLTAIVYGDMSGARTRELEDNLAAMNEQYGDIRVIFRHLPQTDGAPYLAAQASESVAAQGGDEAFWAFHDLLITDQDAWRDLPVEELPARLAEYAGEAGVDSAQVTTDLEENTYQAVVLTMMDPVVQAGANQVPVLIINGIPLLEAPVDRPALETLREIALLADSYPEPPPQVVDPDRNYRAWIETDYGTVVVDLFADIAPQTVNNFAYLACKGYYDGITWHRVIPGFVAQTGDPSGTGIGRPGYSVPDENGSEEYQARGLSFDRAGLLSMAKGNSPNSAGSQWFITYGPAEYLSADFTIFGEVIAGKAALDQLMPIEASGFGSTAQGDALIRVVVREVD
mgnify:CR=1 FL=1